MNATLALLAQMPSVALVLVERGRARRVRVADRSIPVVIERVIRQIVREHVVADVLLGPAQDRVDLEDAVLLLDDAKAGAELGLVAA